MNDVLPTLEALLFAQTLRPVAEQAGPAGDYAVETFARTLVASLEKGRG